MSLKCGLALKLLLSLTFHVFEGGPMHFFHTISVLESKLFDAEKMHLTFAAPPCNPLAFYYAEKVKGAPENSFLKEGYFA